MEKEVITEVIHEEQKKEIYQSKSGFIELPVLRGFTEILPLFNIISKYEDKAFICGGYARYCASPRTNPIEASDIDIYCYKQSIFEGLKEDFKGLKIRHENEISLTYNRPNEAPHAYHPSIQLIKPLNQGAMVLMGDMKSVLSNFDFTVIRVGILSSEKVLADADFEHDERTLILRLKNIHCPISSTLRCMKYATKGYWLKPFETLKLFLDWDSRTNEYREKLRDFLEKSHQEQGLSKEDINELEALMRID